MADTPPKRSGWSTPDPATSITPTPEGGKEKERRGYKVKALPQGLSDLPDNPGGWHRPRSEDTLFRPEDETIIITPVSDEPAAPAPALPPEAVLATPEEVEKFLSPEDVLGELGIDDSTPAVGGASAGAADEPLSPEDVLAALPMLGDDDDGADAADFRTEVMALSLMAGQARADDADDADLDTASTGPTTDEDNDPAAIARRRALELAGGGAAATEALPSGPTQAELESKQWADEEMGRRFYNVQQQMAQLRQLFLSGQITREQAESEIAARELMILTDDGHYWRMSLDDPSWMRSTPDGLSWEQNVNPPWLQTYLNAQQGTGLPLLHTGPQEASAGLGGAVTAPMTNLEYMPLPNRVSPNDMGQTVVGGAAFLEQLDMTDPGAQPTVAGRTVPSGSVGYGSGQQVGIPGAIDESQPPDLDYEIEAELAEQAELAQRQNTTRNIVLGLVALVALVLLGGAAAFVLANNWYDGIVAKYESQIAALANYEPAFQTVIIQDRDGREIARLADAGDRTEIGLNAVSPLFIHAVVSTRNPTFYTDPGWDTGSTLSAYIDSLSGGNAAPVNKTITQIVAENLVLGGGSTTATNADLIVVAGELSKRYGKDFILGLFINEFPFGNNTYGVEAAAQFYFQKSAANLNLVESALLAAIMENPGTVDPVSNRRIKDPTLSVLRRMVQVGCLPVNPASSSPVCVTANDISETNPTFVQTLATVELLPYRPRRVTTQYPHFVQLVRQQLEAVYGQDLYTRGFRVRTTLFSAAQDSAQNALRQRLTDLAGTGLTTGAVVYINPRNGAVLAYVGSPDFDNAAIQGQRDYLRDYRLAGSAITPLIYATALEGVDKNGNGSLELSEYYTPATIVWDVPSQYPAGGPGQAPFAPINVDGRFYGGVPVRYALANQLASAATRVFQDVGEVGFRNTAQNMGIRFIEDAALGLSTGVGEVLVRPIDLVNAYATMGSSGINRHWYVIESITDSNNIEVPLPSTLRQPETPAISAQTAFLLTNILSDESDFARNTPLIPRNSALNIPNPNNASQSLAAALAGQNAGRSNFWTIGLTPNIAIGVWIGTPENSVSAQRQTGMTVSAPLWNQLMRQWVASNATSAFADPGGLVAGGQNQVCSLTGATFDAQQCPGTARNELLSASRLPPPPELGVVTRAAIYTWTGQRANQFCANPEDIVTQTFLNSTDPFVVAYLQSTEGRSLAQRLGFSGVVTPLPSSECDQNTQFPTVSLSSPTPGQTVLGQVQILGQVSAAADFNRFTLEIAPQGSTTFTALAGFPTSSQQPTPGGLLATWDTTTVPSGNYTLRLTAISTTGGYLQRSVQVTVANPTPTPTATPTPTERPIPTLPPFDQATPLPFDPIAPATPTPSPF
jgi:membrane peptidoglycan carboxypeptidase